MPKFLIEVPHDTDAVGCTKAVQALLSTGSHFVTNAEFGCWDGVHCAWLLVEVPSKADALGIVPPAFRASSRVVGLNRFELPKIEAWLSKHATKEQTGRG